MKPNNIRMIIDNIALMPLNNKGVVLSSGGGGGGGGGGSALPPRPGMMPLPKSPLVATGKTVRMSAPATIVCNTITYN